MQYVPKHNIEAEKGVLGAIFFDNNTLRQIDLRVNDFYKPAHREIYSAMLSLSEDGSPIDIITLTERLEKKYHNEIMDIATQAFTAVNIKYHADIVAEASRLHKLQRLCLQILQIIAGDIQETSEALIGQLHAGMSSIIRDQGDAIVDIRDVARETYEFIKRRHEQKGILSGIPSGFKDIDTITDGFQSSDLIILAARPSMGKTALAMSFAQNAAEIDYPVGVVSLEMGKQALGIRTVSSLSQVELWKLRKGIHTREDTAALISAAARMADLPIYFSFSAWELDQIRKVITQMVEVKGIKLVIVDYLQLAGNAKQKTREREIGEISTTLKQLAKTFQIPVIALSQLSREVEKREDKRPKLSDLRDSGQIEQDADVVMFLYREKPREIKGLAEVHFAKGRNIGLGVVKLYFDGNTMTFRSLKDE